MDLGGTGVDQIFEYVRTGGILGLLALAAKLYVDKRKLEIERQRAASSSNAEARRADLDVEQHRDGLTLDLLKEARSELAALREQVERHRPADNHLRHFETALEHIEGLLTAKGEAERKIVERQARAFLVRMRRLADARGTISNELQRLDSAQTLAERGVSGK